MCDFGHETYFQVLLNISSSSSCNPNLQLGIIFHRFFLPFFDFLSSGVRWPKMRGSNADDDEAILSFNGIFLLWLLRCAAAVLRSLISTESSTVQIQTHCSLQYRVETAYIKFLSCCCRCCASCAIVRAPFKSRLRNLLLLEIKKEIANNNQVYLQAAGCLPSFYFGNRRWIQQQPDSLLYNYLFASWEEDRYWIQQGAKMLNTFC